MKIKSIFSTFMRSSSFRKYFFGIFSVLAAITVILGITLSVYSSRAYRDSIADANAKMLNQMVRAQKFTLDEINKSFVNVVTNRELQRFFTYYDNNDINGIRSVMSILDNHIFSNEYIESISVYFCDKGLVLSTIQGVVSIDKYYDRNFVESVRDFPAQQAILRQSTRGLDGSGFLLSFAQKLPYGNSPPEMIVIFDTNDNYITTSTVRGGRTSKIITNKENVVMYSENESVKINDVFVPDERDAKKSYFIADVGGEELMLTYLEMEKYNWNYYISIPLSDVYRSNPSILVIEAILCILMMALSFYLAYVISVRLYLPIKNISDLLQSADESDRDNEIQKIKNNVISLLDNNQSLSKTLENYLLQQKEMFLKAIIDGETDDFAASYEQILRYGLNFKENDFYAAFCISINDYAAFVENYSENQQNLFSVYINDILSGFVSEYGNGFVVNMGLTQMIVVISADKAFSDSMKLDLYDISERIEELLGQDIQQSFSIGVSLVHKDFSNIHCCVSEARRAVESRMVYENTSILLYENIIRGGQDGFEYPFAIEKKLLKCIKTNRKESVGLLIEDFAVYLLKNTTGDILLIRNAFMQLLFVSVHNALETGRDINLGEVVQKTTNDILQGQERIGDLCDCMMEFYDCIFDIMKQKQDNKNQSIVDEIKAYIDTNIGAELSVEQISRQFFISESHLRRIFKSCSGTGIKKYIDEQRMEKAKEMLLKYPDMKIADIANEIGYLSVQSFTVAFKANTDMTPKAYRNDRGKE